MVLSSISPEERIQTFFISGHGHDHCLLWLCRRDSCGSNAETGDSQLWCLRQYAFRTQKVFQMSLASPDSNKTLLQHDSARLHTSVKTQEAINIFVWTVLLHPPYSPNLAPSDFHPFGALKVTLCTTKFETDDNVICTVRSCLHKQYKAWYWQSIPILVLHWHNTIEVGGDFVEK